MALTPDGARPWRTLTEDDLLAIDELVGEADGTPADELIAACRSRGFDVEVVDLVEFPWGEVTRDRRWWRVRVWVRNGIVEQCRRS